MTKMWQKEFEWTNHANCRGDSRWITPPERLSEQDREEVEYGCHRCLVRPECIKEVVEKASSGVFCASVFVPEVSASDTPRRAEKTLGEARGIRETLALSIPQELKRRGEF